MFAKRLKELRENNGYSMDKLVELYNQKFNSKLNKSTLSRYENGLQEPMWTVVRQLAELFHVSTDYLTGQPAKKIETTLFSAPKNKLYEKIERLDKEDKMKVDSFVDGLLTHEKYSVEKSSRADYCEIAAKGGKITRGPKKRKSETTL